MNQIELEGKLKELSGYELLESRFIQDVNAQGYRLRHKKTGARILLLSNDDTNKVFYIGFRTPPEDSTGVAHIVEHTVLCGSRQFPAKDPFIELAKGSLNTFLNAMTYPDKTVYPVASCNEKDFRNLMHVYLDAVFHPNIYQEEKIFMQEGWHYELEDPEGELTLNGVVYNEMRGAFSSPDDVLDREVLNSLFPDTPYGTESGGDPEVIPQLTYEEFLEFHRRYYHPSNSYIYLYGDADMIERLEFMDREYLSGFEALEIDSQIPLQPSFDAPRELRKEYSVMEGEEIQGNTYLSCNMLVDAGLDPRLYIAFQVLDYALCSAPGAPLKEALIRKGIGKDVYSVYENGLRQSYFSIVAKNAEEAQKEEFRNVIRDVLEQQCREGINRKALQAGLNYYEFKFREADFGSYPKGLILGLQSLDSWLYEEDRPFLYLEANETFRELKEALQGDYYEMLVRNYLLENPHQTLLMLAPVRGLTAQKDARLQKRLQEYKESLSAEEVEEIICRTKALKAYQEEPSRKEDLEKIPLLTLKDLKKEAEGFVNEERKAGETRILFHNIFTNGIGYVRLIFDISRVPEDLFPYVGILKHVLGMVDTAHYGYGELNYETNILTGGVSMLVNTYTNARDCSRYKLTFEIKAKLLHENLAAAFALLEETILTSGFEDKKRIYDILAEMRSRMQASMSTAGHSVAAVRALASVSETAAIAEQISGITQYRLLDRLVRCYEEEQEGLADKLKQLVSLIFRAENLMVDYTGSEKEYEGVETLTKQLAERLGHGGAAGEVFRPVLTGKKEGYPTSAQVQYVCRAGNYRKQGYSYTGALRVLKVMMGYDYLWNRVRVKGGAYGCMCSFGKSGDSYFVSYRDPNLTKTLEVFEEAASYLEAFEADDRTMTQFIIGAVSDLDIPMTPAARGGYSLSAYLSEVTLEDLQKEREELLSTDQSVIRGLAAYLRAIMEDGCLCVVGNEEKIREQEAIFEKVEPLFYEQ